MVKKVISDSFNALKKLNAPIKILLIILLVVIMIGIQMLINPLHRSETSIRNYILRLTPLGTSMEDTIKIVKNSNKWEVRSIDYENGFWSQGRPIPGGIKDEQGRTIIGEKSIRVENSYRAFYSLFLLETVVNIYWGFDADGKLIEVYVSKYISI